MSLFSNIFCRFSRIFFLERQHLKNLKSANKIVKNKKFNIMMKKKYLILTWIYWENLNWEIRSLKGLWRKNETGYRMKSENLRLVTWIPSVSRDQYTALSFGESSCNVIRTLKKTCDSQVSVGYNRFQIVCVFAEYNLFKV